jgi:hypothetical protein
VGEVHDPLHQVGGSEGDAGDAAKREDGVVTGNPLIADCRAGAPILAQRRARLPD